VGYFNKNNYKRRTAMTVKKAGNKNRDKAASVKVHATNTAGRERSESQAAAIAITHEQIAERAKAIWKKHGCIPGCDEQNWYEAETQLKAELETV
jgi:hypothetical protein